MKKNKEGFTLIELLVVIAIIALLSSLSVIAINRSRMLARDAKRKADLKNIVIALEMYYQEYGVYPRAGSCAYGTNCYTYSTSGLSWLALLKPYISPPIDPINNAGGPWIDGRYSYSYGNVSADGQEYDLVAQLENTNDPDRCAIKKYRFNLIKNTWCGSYSGQMYAPQ